MATTPVRTFKTAEDCNIVTMANGDLAYGHMTTGGTNRVTPASYLLVRIIEKANRFTVYLGKSLPTAFQGELNLGVASNLQFATVASLEAAHDLLGEDSPLVETTAEMALVRAAAAHNEQRRKALVFAIEDARKSIDQLKEEYDQKRRICLDAAERKGDGFVDLAKKSMDSHYHTLVVPMLKHEEARIAHCEKELAELG
jgi:hypothetical protein